MEKLTTCMFHTLLPVIGKKGFLLENKTFFTWEMQKQRNSDPWKTIWFLLANTRRGRNLPFLLRRTTWTVSDWRIPSCARDCQFFPAPLSKLLGKNQIRHTSPPPPSFWWGPFGRQSYRTQLQNQRCLQRFLQQFSRLGRPRVRGSWRWKEALRSARNA